MIELQKEELLKNSPDYEEYSENVCNLSIDELKRNGLLKCGGCCSKNSNPEKCKSCNGCGNKKCCKNKL